MGVLDFFKKDDSQKQQMDFSHKEQLYNSVLNPSSTAADEQYLIQKKEMLTQLSQWQQDRSPQMQKLFLKLAALQPKKDKKDELEEVKWDVAYCNPNGAAKLVSFIEFLDHNVMLANWSEKRLLITLREGIAHPLNDYLFFNHKEIGMELEHADYVFNLIVNAIEPNYWRGWNNGERVKDQQMIKVNQIEDLTKQEKKKGIFGN